MCRIINKTSFIPFLILKSRKILFSIYYQPIIVVFFDAPFFNTLLVLKLNAVDKHKITKDDKHFKNKNAGQTVWSNWCEKFFLFAFCTFVILYFSTTRKKKTISSRSLLRNFMIFWVHMNRRNYIEFYRKCLENKDGIMLEVNWFDEDWPRDLLWY